MTMKNCTVSLIRPKEHFNPETIQRKWNTSRHASEIDYPLMEEYDFRNDSQNKNVDLDLRPKSNIRLYNEKSPEKTFRNGVLIKVLSVQRLRVLLKT